MTIFRCEHDRLSGLGLGAALGVVLMTSACEKPEVRACETFIKGGLKAPATYKQVGVSLRDEVVTAEQYARENPGAGVLQLETAKSGNNGRRFVTVDYDAENGFGVPIRSSEVCSFSTYEGEVGDKQDLSTKVSLAEAQRSFRQLARSGSLPDMKAIEVAEPDHPCCE